MFVVHLGLTPDQYYALTMAERDAIVEAANKRK